VRIPTVPLWLPTARHVNRRAKGVEEQTIKLFHVCKMRGIPIFTFVNKMDRASKDPFELMEELENVLGSAPIP